jgi:hypothetical protein
MARLTVKRGQGQDVEAGATTRYKQLTIANRQQMAFRLRRPENVSKWRLMRKKNRKKAFEENRFEIGWTGTLGLNGRKFNRID